LATSAQAQPVDQDIQSIREHESSFLQGMDEIVFRYDQEAKRKLDVARWVELALMVLTLLVLALEALFIFSPVTRRIRQDMLALEQKEEDMRHLFSVSPTALLLVDNKNLTILDANQKTAELTGVTVRQLAGSHLQTYLDDTFDANRLFLEKIINNESLNDYEIILLTVQNTVTNALVSVRQIRFAGREVLVLGMTNISDLKKAHAALEHFATFDEMTGLLNRRAGLMILQNSMARCKRDRRSLTLCFADLDGLKTTNDRFGHSEGDWLLRKTAEVLSTSIRAGDVAMRLGGDEFLLIFHDCEKEAVSRLLARIEDRIVAIGIQEHKPFAMGISLGVTDFNPEHHSTLEEFIADADEHMYKMKQQRKRFVVPNDAGDLSPP